MKITRVLKALHCLHVVGQFKSYSCNDTSHPRSWLQSLSAVLHFFLLSFHQLLLLRAYPVRVPFQPLVASTLADVVALGLTFSAKLALLYAVLIRLPHVREIVIVLNQGAILQRQAIRRAQKESRLLRWKSTCFCKVFSSCYLQ